MIRIRRAKTDPGRMVDRSERHLWVLWTSRLQVLTGVGYANTGGDGDIFRVGVNQDFPPFKYLNGIGNPTG